MGWHTNYEIEFDHDIEWDDNEVANCLSSFNVKFLYLRDLDKPRIMVCLYSHNSIEMILQSLGELYLTGMRYRIYNSERWIMFI